MKNHNQLRIEFSVINVRFFYICSTICMSIIFIVNYELSAIASIHYRREENSNAIKIFQAYQMLFLITEIHKHNITKIIVFQITFHR